jgi:hypothetical protein
MGKIRHKCKIFVGKAEGGDRLEDLCIRGSRRVDYVGVNWAKFGIYWPAERIFASEEDSAQ